MLREIQPWLVVGLTYISFIDYLISFVATCFINKRFQDLLKLNYIYTTFSNKMIAQN
jgi:hypothetical protein